MADGNIHYDENPFMAPLGEREPWRRLRGRLAGPVTVWTSGPPRAPAGLTISSLMVADGQPPSVLGLMNETTDLYTTIKETGAFVVHVLERSDAALADEFAGLRPRPGGPFAGRGFEDTEYGPALADVANRAFCRLIDETAAGYQRLVRGAIAKIEIDELGSPLVLFRGRYRALETLEKPDA